MGYVDFLITKNIRDIYEKYGESELNQYVARLINARIPDYRALSHEFIPLYRQCEAEDKDFLDDHNITPRDIEVWDMVVAHALLTNRADSCTHHLGPLADAKDQIQVMVEYAAERMHKNTIFSGLFAESHTLLSEIYDILDAACKVAYEWRYLYE